MSYREKRTNNNLLYSMNWLDYRNYGVGPLSLHAPYTTEDLNIATKRKKTIPYNNIHIHQTWGDLWEVLH